MTGEPKESYACYQASVPSSWEYGISQSKLTVFGSNPGEVSEVVSIGVASLRRSGEPISAHAPGFSLRHDWEKLNTGMGPGEWVCTAERI